MRLEDGFGTSSDEEAVMTRFGFRSVGLAVLAGIVAMSLVAPPVGAEKTSRSFLDFLTGTMELNEKELNRLADGKVMVNVFDAEKKREIVLCGVVRVDVPWEFAFENLKNLAEYRFEDGVVQTRKVGSNPTASDFATFSLPHNDIKDLKKAKIGKSEVKITEDLLKRIQAEVDWSGDYSTDVNRIFRDMLAKRTTMYLEGGLDKLAPYVDKNQPETVRGGMKHFFWQPSILFEYDPKFADYLSQFPAVKLDGTTDFVYWAFEEFGMKPSLSTRHVSIYQPGEEYRTKFVIAEINLYSSHYFQAAYSLTSVLEEEIRDEGKSSYIIWAQRLWFDKELGGLKRRSAQRRLRSAMKNGIQRQGEQLRAEYEKQN